jgi:hypothetical protein
MRAPNVPTSWLIDFQAGTMHDMAQVMRDRVPKVFIIAVTAQRPKIFVRVARVPMDSVVIVPAHVNAPDLSWSMIAITSM